MLTPLEWTLCGLAVAGLATGLTLYIRHGHRRIYRELRQLRELGAQTLQANEFNAQASALKEQLVATTERSTAEAREAVTSKLESTRSQLLSLEASTTGLELRLAELEQALQGVDTKLLAAISSHQDHVQRVESSVMVRLEALDAGLGHRHAEWVEESSRRQEASSAELLGRLENARSTLEMALHAVDTTTRTGFEGTAQAIARLEHLEAARPAFLTPDPDTQRQLRRLQIDLEFVKNRGSSYLGQGIGLTHLVDETPIYINTADIGCPANFINGGRYEEEYLQILASFSRPDSVFLDIGANLGVFSLRLAPYMRQGRIIAFEPNQGIRELFERSVHLNGLRDRVQVLPVGASDETAELVLEVPQGHAGGGHVLRAEEEDGRERIQVRPLDEVLEDLPSFHLAKIDVEGHELHALRGMSKLLARSPEAVVLFEKLIPNAGLEGPVMDLFDEFGMRIWRIDGWTLRPASLQEFERSSAYFIAARPESVDPDRDRNFLLLQPGHLFKALCVERSGWLVPGPAASEPGALLFHGPYWYLPRGVYRVQLRGRLDSPLQMQVAEKFGYAVAQATLSGPDPQFEFVADRDLTHFELVARVSDRPPAFEIASLRVTRIG